MRDKKGVGFGSTPPPPLPHSLTPFFLPSFLPSQYAGTGVFVAHRADGSSWPRYRHAARGIKLASMQAKYVVTRVGATATPTLDDMIKVACALKRGGSDVPTNVVARDLQSDDFPGGQAWEMWVRSGLDPLRVYSWRQDVLGWVAEEAPCG